MAKKQTSDTVSAIAARVLGAGNPLKDDKRLRERLGAAVQRNIEGMTGRGDNVDQLRPVIADAVAEILTPMIEDMQSLAASALSQDEKPK